MPEVTCPACATRQQVDPAAIGYACVSCAAEWDFVTCDACGERFHARPDAAAWTCPSCGAENARHHARAGTGGLGPNRTMLIGVAGVILIALVTFLLTRGGDDPEPGVSTSPTAASAQATLCAHLVDLQTLRTDSLGRTATTLEADAAALRAEGDESLAAAVDDLVVAVRDLAEAYNTPGESDNEQATDAVLDALGPIPC